MKSWIVLMAALAPLAAAAAPRPRIAVMELRSGQGLEPRVAQTLTAILSADAAKGGLDVIAQADIVAMLAFQKQRQMLGCTDDGCLAELGGALGADLVLSGEVARVGSRDHVSLVLVDPRKARVVARSAGFSEAGDDELAVAAQVRFRALLQEARPELLAGMKPIEAPGAVRAQGRRTVAWWTLGAGGALLVGGGVVGLTARSQLDDLKSSWQRPGYQARWDKQRRTALTADVLLGAGAVTAGVGAILWLNSRVPVVAVPVAADGRPGLTIAGRF